MTIELHIQSILSQAEVHSFVLMPNHFHLILSTPLRNLDKIMQVIMSSSTRIINAKARRSGHLYSGRYYWSLIQSPIYYACAYKYVYRNPVKASLCAKVHDWQFSTFAGLIGATHLPIPIAQPLFIQRYIPKDICQLDSWLNIPYSTENSDKIKKALRRKTFKLPIDRKKRKPCELEMGL